MTGLAETLPLALTIAISPVPLAGMLMMTSSPTGLRSSTSFVIGWVVGIAFALTGLAVLGSVIPFASQSGERDTVLILPLVVAAGLVVLGVRMWRKTRAPRNRTVAPRWLRAFENLSPVRGAAFGFVYAAFRPKNLVMTLAAGLIIQQSSADLATGALQVLVFTAVASLSLIVPLLLFAFGGGRLRRILIHFRLFIMKYMSRITSGTFIVLGTVLFVVSVVRIGAETFS